MTAAIDAQSLSTNDRQNAVRRMHYKLNKICADVLNVKNEPPKSAEEYHEWIKITKQSVLPPAPHKFKKDSIPYDIEAQPQNYNVGWVRALAMTEESGGHIQNCVPLFNSCIPSHVILDSRGVGSLLWHCSKLNNKKVSTMVHRPGQYREILWERVFKLSDKVFAQFKDYKFNFLMYSDGVSCSLVFRHPAIDADGLMKSVVAEGARVKELYVDELSQ